MFTMIWHCDNPYRVAETENIVVEHLRHVRGALDDVRDDICEIKQHVGSLEHQYANTSNRLDRMDIRIERIERRLDLTDA
jgi:septation ring formation regulator EzrA